MEFGYSRTQLQLREQAARIAADFDDAYWQRVEEEERFPREYWERLTDEGMLGLNVSKRYGGSGLGMTDLSVAIEALCEGGTGLGGGALFIVGPVFGGCLMERHGSEEQRERFLPGVARGEVWAGAFTEEASGSNVSAIGARAERLGDRYVIEGEKKYVGMAQVGQHMTILARTAARDSANRTEGVSLFLADLPDERVKADLWNKMGTRWMDTSRVCIEGLEVPAGNMVGEEGKAWKPLYDMLNPERIVAAAASVGTGLWCVRRAAEYANERTVWNETPIGAYQGLQFPLVEAKLQLDAALLKVYEAAWLYDRGEARCATVAAAAKYLAVHAALRAADQTMQTLGGAGYMVQSGVERHWRDLRLNRIAPVTDEMTLAYLAQHDMGMPRSY